MSDTMVPALIPREVLAKTMRAVFGAIFLDGGILALGEVMGWIQLGPLPERQDT